MLQLAFIKEISSGVVQIHVKHRGKAVEYATQKEGRDQLTEVRLHAWAFPNMDALLSRTGVLPKGKTDSKRHRYSKLKSPSPPATITLMMSATENQFSVTRADPMGRRGVQEQHPLSHP